MRVIIYSKISWTKSFEIFSENRIVTLVNNGFFEKEVLKTQIENLSIGESFNRTYHLLFMIGFIYFFIQSILLIFIFWSDSYDWRFYLGIIVFSFSLFSLIFYLKKGIYIGEIEISLSGAKRNLYVTKNEFQSIKRSLQLLNNSQI